jgi:hypothetical protein
MTLEEEVQRLIDETMTLEAYATDADLTDVRTHLDRLLTGLLVLRGALLLVARRVDSIESR